MKLPCFCASRVALIVAAIVSVGAEVHNLENSAVELCKVQVREQLKIGVPLQLDLQPCANECFPLPLPEAGRIHVYASVVALAGAVNLRGGWSPEAIGADDTHQTAYTTLSEVLERTSAEYYVCVGTHSPHGCYATVTAAAVKAEDKEGNESEESASPTLLRPFYPMVWQLQSNPVPHANYAFLIGDAEDVQVSIAPLNGWQAKVWLSTSTGPSCQGEGKQTLSSANGSEITAIDTVEVRSADLRALGTSANLGLLGMTWLCIDVAAYGDWAAATLVLAATVTPRGGEGPFVVPGLPTPGRFVLPGLLKTERLSMIAAACENVRMLVKDAIDIDVVATSEDGAPLTLMASLAAKNQVGHIQNQWNGTNPPGDQGAVLMIQGDDLLAARENMEIDSEEVHLAIKVCRGIQDMEQYSRFGNERPRFWLTAVGSSGVVTLEDGVPFGVPVVRSSSAERRQRSPWRDFRFLVPGGSALPKEVTIYATSSGRVQLVADTVRYTDPQAYRWSSRGSGAGGGTNVLRFTTDEKLASDGVQLIRCLFPCYLYISATAASDDPTSTEDVDLQLTATSDNPNNDVAPRPLLEAMEQMQTLAPGESQLFVYAVAPNSSTLIFSLSAAPTREEGGEVKFEASADTFFPTDSSLTTQPARDVILLDCSLPGPCASAMQRAAVGADPKIYVRVKASGSHPCTFAVTARVASDAQVLRNDDEMEGGVEAGGYDRYRFFVGEADAERAEEVVIEVRPYMGSPSVFVSCDPETFPRSDAYVWAGSVSKIRVGEEYMQDDVITIRLKTSEDRFRSGWLYIGITCAFQAAYAVHVHWGSNMETLVDGQELVSTIMPGESRYYALPLHAPDATELQSEMPLSLRVWAISGAVRLCINGLRSAKDSQRDHGQCEHFRDAVSYTGREEMDLAALDLPVASLYPAGTSRGRSKNLRLRVSGVLTGEEQGDAHPI